MTTDGQQHTQAFGHEWKETDTQPQVGVGVFYGSGGSVLSVKQVEQ